MIRACSSWKQFGAALTAATTLAFFPAAFAQTPPPPQQQPQQRLTIGVVEIENDPRYEPIRGFERHVSSEGDAHWEVLLRDVAEALPVSRRQQYIVREIGRGDDA